MSDSAYKVLTRESLIGDEAVVRKAKPDEILESSNEIVGNIPLAIGAKLHAEHDGKALILPIPAATYIEEVLVGPNTREQDIQDLESWLHGTALAERMRRL